MAEVQSPDPMPSAPPPPPPLTGPMSPELATEVKAFRGLVEQRLGFLEQERATRVQKVEAAEARQREAGERQIAAQQGVVEATQEYAKQVAIPPPPLAPMKAEPPVPSITPRGFLNPKSEQGSFENVINGLGLIATMMVGSKAPAFALRAFGGAMQGWAEGDAVRAERDLKEYAKQVDQIREENNNSIRIHEQALRESKGNLEAWKAKVVVAEALAGRADKAADVAGKDVHAHTRSLDDTDKQIDRQYGHLQNMLNRLVGDEGKRQIEQARLEAKRDIARQNFLEKKREFDLKLEQERQKIQDAKEPGMPPEAFSTLADTYILDPQKGRPNFGGRTAKADYEAFWKAVADKTKQVGGPGTVLERRAVAGALRGELAAIAKQEGLVLSFAKSFDLQADKLIKLSETVDRTGVPLLNKYLLWLRNEIQGDDDTAAMNAQIETVSLEFARVTTRSGMSNVTQQEHARKMLRGAQTHDQLAGVIRNVLRYDVETATVGYDTQKAAVSTAIKNLERGDAGAGTPGGTLPPTAGVTPPGGAGKKRTLSSGVTVEFE